MLPKFTRILQQQIITQIMKNKKIVFFFNKINSNNLCIDE